MNYFLAGAIYGEVVLIIIIFFIKLKQRNDLIEQEGLLKARAKALRDAENKIEDLKHLRLQDQNNNITILNENVKLQNLLTEIADRAVTCPLGSEKIVLAKIKDLTRDYQSEN